MSKACLSILEGGEGPPEKCSSPVHGAQSTESSLTHRVHVAVPAVVPSEEAEV